MDFFTITTKEAKGGVVEIYPDFVVGRSQDLMVRGKSFYAIWNENKGLWSRDEYDVQHLVDFELDQFAKKYGVPANVKYMRSFGTNGWNQFRKFMSQISDNSHELDKNLTFANTEVKKKDYVSRRLPYSLAPGDHSAWDELIGTLYSPEERAKIEWAIGAVVSGDSKTIQKFLVFYGPAGTGKSTVLNIIQKLFDGYTTTFEAKALASNNNNFATEVFKGNPLVAIQHDGDLSKIEDNTKLNSIVSHEEMTMNEKFKPSYSARINAILLMGTNQPVKISDAKSGIIRRLIDVHPTGVKLQPNHYHTLMARIDFELGAIANHCLEVYRQMGKNAYNTYRPLEMMLQTDVFFNFIEANFDIFKEQDGVSLKQAYSLYKEFCTDTGIERPLPQYKVREELRNYFEEFKDRVTIDGVVVRSYYSGFTAHPFKAPVKEDAKTFSLVMDETTSIFDLEFAESAAQYAKADGNPEKYWDFSPRLIRGEMKTPRPDQVVKTTLAEIDTSQLHYVQVPESHIVMDFDLTDEDGNKSLEKNLEAASEFPPTYAELSKSEKAVHLHYNYTGGDPTELSSKFKDGIEVKVFTGNSSLRRRLTKCNNVPIADINSGLPLKEKKPVLEPQTIKSEKGLRDLIARNLSKEIHPGTKPSIDFIHKILEETYFSGIPYDVTDLRPKIMAFANNSSNQPLQCLKTVQKMRWQSDEPVESSPSLTVEEKAKDEPLVIFDVEVYPNLFVICWKYKGDDTVVRMINPSAQDVERLFRFKLVGFNNLRYDNHILYGRYMGYNNEQLYKLSQNIINGSVGAMFGEARNLSYADIYDFSSVKQSLKKWEISLGIHHMELDLPWDQPVDEKDIPRVVEYCANDVVATEAVLDAREQDFVARQILAELSGLSVNDTTLKHTAKIIFGNDRNPQKSFVYTDLSKDFPGYVYDYGVSTYRGETTGEGGYVYSEPGIYEDVALLDVASMHPTSIEQLNLFGDYTPNFSALKSARLAIKHKDYESAREMLGGKLSPYLGNEEDATALSDALKIVINIVYGLTSAKFDNPFRDSRNKDNIVAKRGALFMIDLKHAVQEQGFKVAHIKTDSIKIPNATPEIIEFVKQFGEKYGYDFEYDPAKDHYDKLCLVNDAVYIARQDLCVVPVWMVVDESIDETNYVSNIDGEENKVKWTAVGAQFQHPYVFKTLFSRDQITFKDLCEAKHVSSGGLMYLDFNGAMKFVGRSGLFIPVREDTGKGGVLLRVKDEKPYAVTGTKGYFWVEAEMLGLVDSEKLEEHVENLIDMEYFERLAEEARKTIEKFGSFHEFVS